jgi:carboxymethylenebutenolidase
MMPQFSGRNDDPPRGGTRFGGRPISDGRIWRARPRGHNLHNGRIIVKTEKFEMSPAQVKTRSLTIATDTGNSGSFNAYLAEPAHSGRVGIVLLPEMFGLSPAMLEGAEDFAALGYATLVPNMFWRAPNPELLSYEGPDRQQAFDRLQALDYGAAVADTGVAARALMDLTGCTTVAALGHCIGGRLAMLALPDTEVAGAISYYGLGISQMGEALARLRKPAQLHYGLADGHVPLEEIKAVEAAMKGNPNITIHRYAGAGHSFCNPRRPMFDAAAAGLVRDRTVAFLQVLGGT